MPLELSDDQAQKLLELLSGFGGEGNLAVDQEVEEASTILRDAIKASQPEPEWKFWTQWEDGNGTKGQIFWGPVADEDITDIHDHLVSVFGFRPEAKTLD